MADKDSNDPLQVDGSREEFVLLFSRERRRIYGFTYSMVPVVSDAEDIFQQVSLVLWRRFSEYDPAQDFYKWACGIVYYTVLNYRRSKRRGKVYFSDELVQKLAEDRIEWSTAESERSEALQQCLTLLKTKDRRLVTQVYGSELSPREAAKTLGQTVQSVYNRLSFIRKRLLECVTNRLESPTQCGG